MNDKIGNTIELSSDPNGHVLILGQTGQGKTYELCRLVEDYCGQGKRILIIDYSGSFTERELVEKGFQCGKHIKRVNLAKEEFKWCFRVRNIIDAIDDIADVILDVVKCEAYFQRKWMYQMIKELMGKRGYVSIPEIIQRLENKLYDEQLSESIHGNVEEVGKLLTRLEIYRRFKDFYICPFDKEDNADDKLIYILDVTEFPKRQRDFLSELMISLLWKETYRQEVKNRCEIVILDEFQHIPFNGNSAVSGILREGRKRNLSAILSTQHTGRYSKAYGFFSSLCICHNKISSKWIKTSFHTLNRCIKRL